MGIGDTIGNSGSGKRKGAAVVNGVGGRRCQSGRVDNATVTLWQRLSYPKEAGTPAGFMVIFSPSQMTEETTERIRRRLSS